MTRMMLSSRTIIAIGVCGLTACTSFRGLGDLRIGSPGETTDDGTVVAAPVATGFRQPPLTLNGDRSLAREAQVFNFDWPVDEARLTRGFFAAPSRRKRPHWGVDLANRKGTPIMAAERGTVIYTGNAFHGFGRLVVIEHNEEWATLYSHLDKILVKEGQVVTQGESIGLMGRTGRATGVHLHFEIRHFRQPVNPLAHLPMGNGRAQSLSFREPGVSLPQWKSQASRSEPQSDQ